MNILLANFDKVEAEPLKDWLIIMAAVMGLVLLGLHLFAFLKGRGTTIGPSPFIVTAAEATAKREEVQALARRVDRIEQQLPEMEMRIIREIHSGNVNLATKIEAMATGAYQGRQKIWEAVNQHREKISRLEGVLGRMPVTAADSH